LGESELVVAARDGRIRWLTLERDGRPAPGPSPRKSDRGVEDVVGAAAFEHALCDLQPAGPPRRAHSSQQTPPQRAPSDAPAQDR